MEIDKKTTIDVKCQVKNLSFSAHADAKGIMQLIKQAQPRNVMLVHGEKGKMAFLKQKIMQKFQIPCFDPANGTTVVINTTQLLPVDLSVHLLKKHLALNYTVNSNNKNVSMGTDQSMLYSEQPPTKKLKGIADGGDGLCSAASVLDEVNASIGVVDKVALSGVLLMDIPSGDMLPNHQVET